MPELAIRIHHDALNPQLSIPIQNILNAGAEDLGPTPFPFPRTSTEVFQNATFEIYTKKEVDDNLSEIKQGIIGKYLSSLRKLDHIIAPKEGVEAQL
jgi:hypothetical protein